MTTRQEQIEALARKCASLERRVGALQRLEMSTLGLIAEPANHVFAGPANGADAVPTFRALTYADEPTAQDALKLSWLGW